MRELERESIFLDEDALSSQYIPSSLPHREANVRELATLFRNVLLRENAQPRRALITGPVGSGKTSVSKAFGKSLVKAASRFKRDVRYVHVNCRARKNPFLVLLAIARTLNEHIPARGHSQHELLSATIDHLIKNDIHLVVSLDEFDSMSPKTGKDLIYSILRSSEDRPIPYVPISLILISRFMSSLNYLDDSTRSSFLSCVLPLQPYTKPQLRDILADRLSVALRPGSIGIHTLDLILNIASRSGDARFALELSWASARAADAESCREISCDHVRLAKMKIEPQVDLDDLEALSNIQLIIVAAAAKSLNTTGLGGILQARLYDEFVVLCESEHVPVEPLHRFEAFVKDLSTSGLLVVPEGSNPPEAWISELPVQAILSYYDQQLPLSARYLDLEDGRVGRLGIHRTL